MNRFRLLGPGDGDLVVVWWALGDRDKVYYYLKRLIERRMGPINYLFELPTMKGMMDDPRVAALLQR